MSAYSRNIANHWHGRNETVAPLEEIRKTLADLDKSGKSDYAHTMLRRRLQQELDNPSPRVDASWQPPLGPVRILARALPIPNRFTKPNMIDLLELIPRCHEAAKAKGFWDETPNAGQQLMLVISELSEALEADRKGRRANMASWAEPRHDCNRTMAFEHCIKDSVEDELADAYIRLCDFAGGFGLDTDALIATENEWYDLCAGVGQNLGEALLSITHDVASAWANEYETAKEVPLGTAMAEIRLLTEREGIDLATHIDLKLRYNATRNRMHGKAY